VCRIHPGIGQGLGPRPSVDGDSRGCTAVVGFSIGAGQKTVPRNPRGVCCLQFLTTAAPPANCRGQKGRDVMAATRRLSSRHILKSKVVSLREGFGRYLGPHDGVTLGISTKATTGHPAKQTARVHVIEVDKTSPTSGRILLGPRVPSFGTWTQANRATSETDLFPPTRLLGGHGNSGAGARRHQRGTNGPTVWVRATKPKTSCRGGGLLAGAVDRIFRMARFQIGTALGTTRISERVLCCKRGDSPALLDTLQCAGQNGLSHSPGGYV